VIDYLPSQLADALGSSAHERRFMPLVAIRTRSDWDHAASVGPSTAGGAASDEDDDDEEEEEEQDEGLRRSEDKPTRAQSLLAAVTVCMQPPSTAEEEAAATAEASEAQRRLMHCRLSRILWALDPADVAARPQWLEAMHAAYTGYRSYTDEEAEEEEQTRPDAADTPRATSGTASGGGGGGAAGARGIDYLEPLAHTSPHSMIGGAMGSRKTVPAQQQQQQRAKMRRQEMAQLLAFHLPAAVLLWAVVSACMPAIGREPLTQQPANRRGGRAERAGRGGAE
jgi:hypothetical protein